MAKDDLAGDGGARGAAKGGAAPVGAAALEALIAQTAGGSRAAFDQVYLLTRRRVYGLLMMMLRDADDAADVLQEVYLRLWRKAHLFQPSGSQPLSWVLALARNAAIDRIRSRQRNAPHEPFEDVHPQTGGLVHEERITVSHCLAQLAPERAALVRDVYLRGLSYDEVCRDAGVPLNTVKSWLRRAILSLKACMTQEA